MVDKALKLARGLVRPIVTVMFSVGVLWGFSVGMVPQEAFMTIVSMVIVFWFSDRKSKNDSADGGGM